MRTFVHNPWFHDIICKKKKHPNAIIGASFPIAVIWLVRDTYLIIFGDLICASNIPINTLTQSYFLFKKNNSVNGNIPILLCNISLTFILAWPFWAKYSAVLRMFDRYFNLNLKKIIMKIPRSIRLQLEKKVCVGFLETSFTEKYAKQNLLRNVSQNHW